MNNSSFTLNGSQKNIIQTSKRAGEKTTRATPKKHVGNTTINEQQDAPQPWHE